MANATTIEILPRQEPGVLSGSSQAGSTSGTRSVIAWLWNVSRNVLESFQRLEIWCYDGTRHEDTRLGLLIGVLLMVLGLLCCLPFIVTGAWSIREAHAIFSKGKKEDIHSADFLSHTHWMNCFSGGVSLLCFSAWLFFSPHASSTRGAVLDRLRKCPFSGPVPMVKTCTYLCL